MRIRRLHNKNTGRRLPKTNDARTTITDVDRRRPTTCVIASSRLTTSADRSRPACAAAMFEFVAEREDDPETLLLADRFDDRQHLLLETR